MKLEVIRKHPGIKVTLWWGKEGQFTIYMGTNTAPLIKVYVFRDSFGGGF